MLTIEPIFGRVYYSKTGSEGWCPDCHRHFWDRVEYDESTLGRMHYVVIRRQNGGLWGEFICKKCAGLELAVEQKLALAEAGLALQKKLMNGMTRWIKELRATVARVERQNTDLQRRNTELVTLNRELLIQLDRGPKS